MNDALRVALRDTGHTIESLAERVGVDPKTVSRWLLEDRIPHARHRLTAADALQKNVSDIWPDISRRRALVWFRPWQEIEREATTLRSFESMVVPGLLQTEAYARAVLAGGGLIPRSEVARLVDHRMSRQLILHREEPPLLTAVLDEAVLRRRSAARPSCASNCWHSPRRPPGRISGCMWCRPQWANTLE